MRKLNLLLLCGTVLSFGLGLPGDVRADDRDTPFDVYARYARKIVSISERGAGAMDDVVEAAGPRIRRLQNAGEFRRARAMAARAVGKIGQPTAELALPVLVVLALELVRLPVHVEDDCPLRALAATTRSRP